ncbi:MAG: hypothetical protein Q8Q04_00360 [archaeon]|nr:hypothetical protein [archaeon]
MNKYHIGTRLRGFSKKFLKEKRSLFSETEDVHYVPHITFVRPFFALNETLLVENFEDTCKRYVKPMKFNIENFDLFDLIENEKKVLYSKVNPDKKMNSFIESLEKNLSGIISYEENSPSDRRNLHATVYIGENYKEIKKFIEEDFFIDQYLLRTYLLKDKKILYEYDFFLQKLLNRENALDKKVFTQTIESLKNKTGFSPSKEGFVKNYSPSGTRAKRL